jgi:hypothetical protein
MNNRDWCERERSNHTATPTSPCDAAGCCEGSAPNSFKVSNFGFWVTRSLINSCFNSCFITSLLLTAACHNLTARSARLR